jgi:membrane associated rhomboid family serine protease
MGVIMNAPPKWTDFAKYPVITGVAVLAVGVTIAWWAKVDISPLFESAEIRRGQVWRLATSIFPHVDILHLAFNIYWLWIFGTLVERVYGHAKTALLIALFAIGPSSLDFAFDRGGVGLSGVGYGLFGLLYVLSVRDERFRGAIDQRTTQLFIGWFFLCILTTVTHIYPVGNIAHGAGATLGILVGLAVTLPNRRLVLTASTIAIVLFGLWGSTLGRPSINLSGKAGFEEGQWGYRALLADQNENAARWLRDAAKMQPNVPSFWFDLGIAYERLGNIPAANNAYERAHGLDPTNLEYSRAAKVKN